VLLAAGRAAGAPEKSADVVEVKLDRFTIADGLESFFVSLTVAKGWHVDAPPANAKPPAGRTPAMEFQIDGKKVSVNDIHYPDGADRKGPDGKAYRAYAGAVAFTAWLHWDETQNAKVISVRVTVTATDGKTRLKESVVTAETK
jgi:hypothetical protein